MLLLALFATSCATSARIDEAASSPDISAPSDDAAPAPSPTTPPATRADESPTPRPTAPAASGSDAPPRVETPTSEPDAEPVRWTGEPASSFTAPDDWLDELEVTDQARHGTLDNGVRWIVQRNGAPGGQAQLRLVVRSGSLVDAPGASGAAHYLEHMLFNGTERFPDNELITVLEGFGSAFGPDLNAYTSTRETVYRVTVPTNRAGAVELGLDVLREWADRATIEPDAVDDERGVIREELRRGAETAAGRIWRELREDLLVDTAFAGKAPIGTLADIDAMSADALRAHYEAWYRPELLAVVVVGEIDVDATIGQIQSRFDQLEGSVGVAPVAPDADDVGPLPQTTIRIAPDPELTRTEVELYWRRTGTTQRNRSDLREEMVRSLASALLNRRVFEFVERGQGVDAGFTDGGAGRFTVTSGVEIVSLRGTGTPEGVVDRLGALVELAEQIRQHGVDQVEFDEAVNELRVAITQQADQASTRQDREVADELVAWDLGVGVPIGDRRAPVELEVLATIEPQDIAVALHQVLQTPVHVLVSGPPGALLDVELAELRTRLDRTLGVVVDPRPPSAALPTTLMEPPQPAEIVDRVTLPTLSATVVTFENGLRLAYRNTTITDEFVMLQGWSRGGFFLHDGPEVPLLGSAAALVLPSGFASIDTVTLERLRSGSVASLTANVGRAEETLNGEAATGDLETLLQLVHLQMTDPTISDTAIARFDEGWRAVAADPATQPALAADLELWQLRYGDSPYFRRAPTLADLDSLDRDLLIESWRERFGNAGDFVFVVVGDFDPATLEQLAAQYLGTLPTTGEVESSVERDPGVPQENLVSTVAVGVGEQGRVRINWESPYPFTQRAAVAAEALELIVDARLRDLVREELGASYAPRASISVLSEPVSWVDTIIEVETDPDRLAEVSDTIRAELERIRNGDLDPVYVETAIVQMRDSYRFFRNRDWIEFITFHLANPGRPAGEFDQRSSIASSLTLEELAETARVVFPADRSVEVRLVPAADG